MPDLAAFENSLRAIAGDAVRPLLCDGSPFECSVFLVGINPSRNIPLWDHWSPLTGCNKKAWLAAYEAKHKRGPTRQRIEKILEGLHPARAIETNVIQHRSPREADLSAEQSADNGVFEFLVKTLKPKVMFVHGRTAVKCVERLTSSTTERGAFVRVNYQGHEFELITGHHLSYQWKLEAAKALGAKLRAQLQNS